MNFVENVFMDCRGDELCSGQQDCILSAWIAEESLLFNAGRSCCDLSLL